MTNLPRDEYFPSIDILRGVAAYSVIMLHVIAHTSWTSFPTTGLLSWFRSGDLGVDLFFVISGFVVYYNARGLFQKNSYGCFLISFFARRAARIYPLYIMTMVFSIVVAQRYLLDFPSLWVHFLSHTLFIHSFSLDWFSSINGVNWSIAIEVQFYVLLALVIPLLTGRRAIVACVCAIVIAWLWRWMSWHLVPPDGSELRLYRLFVLSTQLPGRLDQFAAGMLIAALVRSGTFSALRASAWGLWLSLGAAAVSIYVLVFPQMSIWPSGEVAFVLARSTSALAFSLVILAACQLNAAPFLTWTTPLRYAGTISYGLYLWHLPLLSVLKETGLSPLAVCLATLTVTTLVAALSWHLMERPMIRVSRRLEVGVLARSTA